MKIEADIDELIQIVSTAIETHTTAFLLADNRKRVLSLCGCYSLSDNIVENTFIPYGYGPIGWVAENMRPFDLAKFTDRDSGMLRLYSKNEEIKSFAAVPVLRGDTLVGVLCVDSKTSFVYTNKEQKLLTIFSKLFADFVNNINLREFIDTDSSGIAFLHSFCRKISSINKIEIIVDFALESIIDLLKCCDCFICLRVDEKEPYFCIVAVRTHRNLKNKIFTENDGLAGCVISGKEPILLVNRGNDFGSNIFKPSMAVSQFSSFMGIPLLSQNKALGLICVIDKRKNYFKPKDQQIISIMADNIAIAVSGILAREQAMEMLKSFSTEGVTNSLLRREI